MLYKVANNNDRVVEAKSFASLDLAEHSKMDYDMVVSSTIINGQYKIKAKGKNLILRHYNKGTPF